MKFALDTNAYTAFQLGHGASVKALVDTAELIGMPFVVDAELRAGFKKGEHTKDNYAKLQRFQMSDRVFVLWPDAMTGELYARVWAELSAAGKPIPTNDIWIAAICLQHHLPLATADRHFKQVPLLQTLSV